MSAGPKDKPGLEAFTQTWQQMVLCEQGSAWESRSKEGQSKDGYTNTTEQSTKDSVF